MLKEQQEDHKPGEEPATGRVAGDDARKVVGPGSWRALQAIVRTLDFKAREREYEWTTLASGWST